MKNRNSLLLLLVLFCFQHHARSQSLKNKIKKSVVEIGETFTEIPKERVAVLDQLAATIFNRNKTKNRHKVVFIDQDNLETSQLAMIWLRTGLLYFGLEGYQIHSAGIGSVQKPVPGLASINKYGFKVSNAGGGKPFSYTIKYGSDSWIVNSKTLESLNLQPDSVLEVFVTEGIAPDNGTPKIEIPLYDLVNIPKEMLYIATRINNLNEITQ